MKLDFLEIDELERITRRKTAKAMAKRLTDMKLPYILDGNGWPLVLRSNIERLLDSKQKDREAEERAKEDEKFERNLATAFDHLKKRKKKTAD